MTGSKYCENNDDDVTRIFLIRHGQTDHNVQKILQGHTDIPINKEGFAQSKKLGQFFSANKRIQFDKVYSSDLTRCKQTLDEILKNVDYPLIKNDEEIEYSNALRERNMGIIEGMHMDAAEKYAKEHGKPSFRDFGETNEEFHTRLSGKIIDIIENDTSNKKNVAIVSHGGSIRNIFNWLSKESNYYTNKSKVIVYNTSVSIVDYNRPDKTFNIIDVGNTEHLGEGEFVVKDTRLR